MARALRKIPQRRPPAPKRPSNIAGPEHAERASAEVAAALAAVDSWAEGDGEATIDLTDSCMAAVEAATERARDLGAVVSTIPGKRVVLRLSAPLARRESRDA